MNRLCCLLFYTLILNFCQAKADDDPRIVGGFEANKDDYPYVVSLRNANNRHFCGGTIIDDQHVVTAAHCVAGGSAKYVVVGSDSLDHGGTQHEVLSSTMHPEYNSTFVRHDIAVLKIAKGATYKFSFPPRMQSDLTDYESPCYVMGWGLTKAGGELSNKFKVAAVKPVPPAECRKEWKELFNPRLICTSSEENAACQGDSGGPLICENRFAGIVSFGKPCATGKPDVFTAVNSYNGWIDETIH